MKLELESISLDNERMTTRMEHNGIVLRWNCKLIEKTSFTGEFDLFEQINGFWATRSKAVQDRVFEIYTRIYRLLEFLEDASHVTQELYGLVHDLYECHDLADLKHWIYFNTNIADPPTLDDTFTENNDSAKTRERTYTRPDYHWLVTLSVALRPMIPIWGEFINKTGSEAGTIWKEYKAVNLLATAGILSSAPMTKLQQYVESFIPTDKLPTSAIVEGLSSEDYPRWILSLVLVRRLCLGDVRGHNPEFNLAAFIHKFIAAKIKGQETSFGGSIKEKNIEGAGQDGENNLSRLEGYKIKQDIPDGDIEIIGYPIEHPMEMALRICPDLDLSLLQASVESVQLLSTERIADPQIVLIQIVLESEIPVPGVLYFSKQQSHQAMAIAQALLWHRKYYELAGLVSGIVQENTGAMNIGVQAPKTRISKEQQEILDARFTQIRRVKAKAPKKFNPAAESIEELATNFSKNSWRLTLPPEWSAQLTGNKTSRRFDAPHDIRVKLADLAISISTRSFYSHV